jgi:hypothetical protein
MRRVFLLALSVAAFLAGCANQPVDFTSQAGNYRVRFPGSPKESDKSIASPVAGTVKLFTAMRTTSADQAYSVNYVDYPESFIRGVTADALLGEAMNGIGMATS